MRDPKFALMHPIEAARMHAELEDMTKTAVYARSTAAGQGQVREGEYPREAKSFPFASVFDPTADAIIGEQRRQNSERVNTIVSAHGGEYVTPGYAQTGAGLKPMAVYQGRRAAPVPMANPQTGGPMVVTPVHPIKP